jgi:hypothetical protein
MINFDDRFEPEILMCVCARVCVCVRVYVCVYIYDDSFDPVVQ